LEAVVGGGWFIARFGVGESEISVVMAEFSDGLKTYEKCFGHYLAAPLQDMIDEI
jgi:hypothetical protein